MSKVKEALRKIKPEANKQTLIKLIKAEILSHGSERGRENTLLFCTPDCLAKSIANKVHYDMESKL